jgi:hypothetical protein
VRASPASRLRQCLALLVRCQLAWPAHVNARCLGSRRPTLASASLNQLSFKLRKPAQDREHEPAVRVVVSAQVSASDLNPAPRLAISSSVLSKSRAAERTMDSMRVVIHFVIVQLALQVRGVPKKYPIKVLPPDCSDETLYERM